MTERDLLAPARPATLAGRPGTRPSRIVLADDAPLIHLAIRALLAPAPGYSLVGAAGSVTQAEQLIRRAQPDLLICEADIGGESGIGLCRWVRRTSPRTAVVILTSRDEPLLARSALDTGACGYLLKTSLPADLLASLGQALAGLPVVDGRLGLTGRPLANLEMTDLFGLSPREREVLEVVVLGLDNRAIAARLFIAEETVKCHVKAILRKLGARDRTHAVALALGAGAMFRSAWAEPTR